MGLSITWHRGLTKANGNEAFDEHGEILDGNGWFQLWVNPNFPGRADEIESRCAYHSEQSGRFDAGTYGGYGVWRNQLAVTAGWPEGTHEPHRASKDSHASSAWAATEGPFWELIEFSDCEGVIGAAVSAKLARDFAEHQGKADQHPDPHFRALYAEWRNAFEKASDRGCVKFH